jgi:hypothetical protein
VAARRVELDIVSSKRGRERSAVLATHEAVRPAADDDALNASLADACAFAKQIQGADLPGKP